jgi:glutathione synthase/RimK-type ligase-like ATP-grasp enzyme
MKKLIKSFLLTIYIFRKLSWYKVLKNYNNNSKNVIYLSFFAGRYGNEILAWDASNIDVLSRQNISFRFSLSLKNHNGCNIFWSPSRNLIQKSIANYSKSLVEIATLAEKNGNILIPSAYEVSFLENKTTMYDFFQKNGIRTPETVIYKRENKIPNNFDFPILVKGEHSSGSQDIYEFHNYQDLILFLNKSDYWDKFEHLIIQKLINIRKDLRVILVGNEVVLYYWRINPTEDWKPTASSFGGLIRFDDYPQYWNTYILEAFSKLNISMGAFDVAWDNDDLNTEPYFLEVSSRFSPNPSVEMNKEFSYAKWKKQLFGNEIYYKKQCDLIFEINRKNIKLNLL